MMGHKVLREETTKDRRWKLFVASPLPFLILAALSALLIGGIVGMLSFSIEGLIFGALVMALIVLLRQDELAAVVILVVQLYLDWYLVYRVISVMLITLLLCVFFLTRSSQRPWAEPRAWWLWALFLGLTIFPAIRGALTRHDAAIYYPNIIFGAFVAFWLGTVIARNIVSVRRFFQLLAGFGVLVAMHTIIQATTGITLLGSSLAEEFLRGVASYRLADGLDVYRVGSFFIDPNWNGTFLATVLLIPFGLFIEASSFLGKLFAASEILIILSALLFTYSAGAWGAAISGVIVFVALVGHTQYRLRIPLFILVITTVILILFPEQIRLLLQHASDPTDLQLRTGTWQTAIRVIQAFPLTGVGLGYTAYLQNSEPYLASAQQVLQEHPHNSYLELGAMAGLPVLLVFLALVVFALWLAFQNWRCSDNRGRSLLGAGIAAIIVLSVNSWSINGWTLPPLAITGWLILGTISSPLLTRYRGSKMQLLRNSTMTHSSY